MSYEALLDDPRKHGKIQSHFKNPVAKDLHGLPHQDVQKILKRFDLLADDPREYCFFKTSENELNLERQGFYRIVYQINDDRLTVQWIKVGHSSSVDECC